MPLAHFMRMGRERYADKIEEYRTLKRRAQELGDSLRFADEGRKRLEQLVKSEENPMGGEDTARATELKNELAMAMREVERLTAESASVSARASDVKRSFPSATISGLFSPSRRASNLVRHSGFICIDIDDHYTRLGPDGAKQTFHQPLDSVADVLPSIPWIAYAGHSVGGVGYFALIPLGVIDAQHTHQWYFTCLQEEFEQLGLVIDPACKDVTRLRFCSYDDFPVVRNARAVAYLGNESFVGRREREKQRISDERRKYYELQARRSFQNTQDVEYNRVRRCVEEITRRRINIAESYDDWWKISCCLASTFGERGRELFHAISRLSPKYNATENDRKYDEFLRKSQGRLSIATLMKVFEENGVYWKV